MHRTFVWAIASAAAGLRVSVQAAGPPLPAGSTATFNNVDGALDSAGSTVPHTRATDVPVGITALAKLPASVRFGYYDTNLTETGAYTTVYQADSIADAAAAYAQYGVPSLLLAYDTFFVHVDGAGLVLQPNYLSDWAALASAAEPFLANGTLLGFNLGDELVWNCLAPANLTVAAEAVRASFARGSAILWYNEAAWFGDADRSTWRDSCGNNPADYSIPAALDWFSVDIYHMDGPVAGWVDDRVRGWYGQWVYPNLTATQQVVLVPGSFGSDVNHWPNGTYVCDRDCYDAMCALDAGDFAAWAAAADSRVAAVMPWNWGGCASCNGSRWTPPHTCCMDELGTRVQPRTRAAWQAIASAA